MKQIVKEKFDPSAKIFYEHYFTKIGLWVNSEREVFSHARKIDRVVVCKNSQKEKLQQTAFKHFEALNSLEFKGLNDDLNINEFNKIQMRAWALASNEFEQSEHEPSRLPEKKTITIICSTRPTKILDRLPNSYGFEKTERNGIYLSKHHLNTYIIYPTELTTDT